ncbi:hypothetical protein [Kitasatospora sp. HPMI-4]|uniref:hypothetical protein n=1 Tax=Kitasatospora sp. HPMI-4 TaxID=3448443 RepID=UPI003F1D4664
MDSTHANTFARKAGLAGRFLGASAVAGAGVLSAGLVLPAVGGLGPGAKNAVGDFNSLPDDFTTPPLSQASTIAGDYRALKPLPGRHPPPRAAQDAEHGIHEGDISEVPTRWRSRAEAAHGGKPVRAAGDGPR